MDSTIPSLKHIRQKCAPSFNVRERERERKQTRVPLVDRNAQFRREGKRQRKQPSRVHRSLPDIIQLV